MQELVSEIYKNILEQTNIHVYFYKQWHNLNSDIKL
jgi:hypothetical protein